MIDITVKGYRLKSSKGGTAVNNVRKVVNQIRKRAENCQPKSGKDIEILTESKDVKQYVKRMRARDPELNSKWGTICTPVEMLAPDGKSRKTNAADLEGIFRIIQSIPSKKAEPFKVWMAQVASQRLPVTK